MKTYELQSQTLLADGNIQVYYREKRPFGAGASEIKTKIVTKEQFMEMFKIQPESR